MGSCCSNLPKSSNMAFGQGNEIRIKRETYEIMPRVFFKIDVDVNNYKMYYECLVVYALYLCQKDQEEKEKLKTKEEEEQLQNKNQVRIS